MIQTTGRKEKGPEEPSDWSVSTLNSGLVRTATPGELALNDPVCKGIFLSKRTRVHGPSASERGTVVFLCLQLRHKCLGPLASRTPSEL